MSVPAKTSFKTTSFGVQARELIIAGTAGFVGLAILAIPIGSIFIRIVVAAGLFSGGILYAFWRIERTWNIEEYFFNRWKHGLRSRRFVKGGSEFDGTSIDIGPLGSGSSASAREEKTVNKPALERPATGWSKVLVWAPDWLVPHSNIELSGMVLSVFALVVFLAWMWTSGDVATLQGEIQILVSHMINR